MKCPNPNCQKVISFQCPYCQESFDPVEKIELDLRSAMNRFFEFKENVKEEIEYIKGREKAVDPNLKDELEKWISQKLIAFAGQLGDKETGVSTELIDQRLNIFDNRLKKFESRLDIQNTSKYFELAERFRLAIKNPRDVLILTLKPVMSYQGIADLFQKLGFIPQTRSGVMKKYQRILERQKQLTNVR